MSRYRRGYASDNVTLKDNLEDALIDSIESDDENKKYKNIEVVLNLSIQFL